MVFPITSAIPKVHYVFQEHLTMYLDFPKISNQSFSINFIISYTYKILIYKEHFTYIPLFLIGNGKMDNCLNIKYPIIHPDIKMKT